MLHSGIYEGVVRHRRSDSVQHEFRMPLFMMYLDLDEIGRVFTGSLSWSATRPALARFRRDDFLADAQGDRHGDLKEAVRSRVREALGRTPSGPIRLLTHLRYVGYSFNPVSFYYCFDQDGRVDAIVAEITNVPWRERHAYVLDAASIAPRKAMRFSFDKEFHVSPLMPMEMRYHWAFNAPSEQPGGKIGIHMALDRQGKQAFDATLALTRREITPAALRSILWRYPAMTLGVIARIHWEAWRTYRKGAPFNPNPETLRRRRARAEGQPLAPRHDTTGVPA